MKNLLLLAIFCFGWQACRNKNTQNKNSKLPTTDTLHFDYKQVTDSSKYLVMGDINGYKERTKASISYPDFENHLLDSLILRKVFDYFSPEEQTSSYRYITKSFIDGFDEHFRQSQNTLAAWFLDIDVSVIYQQKGYISLKYIHSDYTGGAHATTTAYFLNYDTQHNHTILLDGLILPHKKANLLALAEKKFRAQQKLGAKQPLTDYFFKNNQFELPENFYIDKNGLNFYYNAGEIKPHVYGSTNLLLPLADLQSIIKPNTILTTH